MKFRDLEQRARVAQTICGWIGRPNLWHVSPPMPDPEAAQIHATGRIGNTHLCEESITLLGVAWTVWGCAVPKRDLLVTQVTVLDVLQLDSRYVIAVGNLIGRASVGDFHEIDLWIAYYRTPYFEMTARNFVREAQQS